MTDAGALVIIYMISVMLLFFGERKKAQPELSFRLGFEM